MYSVPAQKKDRIGRYKRHRMYDKPYVFLELSMNNFFPYLFNLSKQVERIRGEKFRRNDSVTEYQEFFPITKVLEIRRKFRILKY